VVYLDGGAKMDQVVYKVDITENTKLTDWDFVFKATADQLNQDMDRGYMLSSANSTKQDAKIVAVWSWDRNLETKFED